MSGLSVLMWRSIKKFFQVLNCRQSSEGVLESHQKRKTCKVVSFHRSSVSDSLCNISVLEFIEIENSRSRWQKVWATSFEPFHIYLIWLWDLYTHSFIFSTPYILKTTFIRWAFPFSCSHLSTALTSKSFHMRGWNWILAEMTFLLHCGLDCWHVIMHYSVTRASIMGENTPKMLQQQTQLTWNLEICSIRMRARCIWKKRQW